MKDARLKSVLPSLKDWVDTTLALVYPEVCQVCSLEPATATGGFVCAACWQKVRFIKRPFCDRCGLPFEGEITNNFECTNCKDMELHFRQARSAVSYTGIAKDILHHYKYQGQLWFEPFLADLLIRAAAAELAHESVDLIVPVPLHAAKRREREFNQAERLAACLSRATGIPLNTNALRRVKPTQTQTRLTKQQRAENVRGAFALGNAASLTGRRVVVLDDVFTTGATTSACAKLLRSAGAADVCVWTVARGL